MIFLRNIPILLLILNSLLILVATAAASSTETYCTSIQPDRKWWKRAKKTSPHLITELELLETFPQSVWIRSIEDVPRTISLIQDTCTSQEVVTVVIKMAGNVKQEHQDSWKEEYATLILNAFNTLKGSKHRINVVIEPGMSSDPEILSGVFNSLSTLPKAVGSSSFIQYYVSISRDQSAQLSRKLKSVAKAIPAVGVAFEAWDRTSSLSLKGSLESSSPEDYCNLVRKRTRMKSLPCLLDASTTLEAKPSLPQSKSTNLSVAWLSLPGSSNSTNEGFDAEKFVSLWNHGYFVTRNGAKRVAVDGITFELYEELSREDESPGWFSTVFGFFLKLFRAVWTFL